MFLTLLNLIFDILYSSTEMKTSHLEFHYQPSQSMVRIYCRSETNEFLFADFKHKTVANGTNSQRRSHSDRYVLNNDIISIHLKHDFFNPEHPITLTSQHPSPLTQLLHPFRPPTRLPPENQWLNIVISCKNAGMFGLTKPEVVCFVNGMQCEGRNDKKSLGKFDIPFDSKSVEVTL